MTASTPPTGASEACNAEVALLEEVLLVEAAVLKGVSPGTDGAEPWLGFVLCHCVWDVEPLLAAVPGSALPGAAVVDVVGVGAAVLMDVVGMGAALVDVVGRGVAVVVDEVSSAAVVGAAVVEVLVVGTTVVDVVMAGEDPGDETSPEGTWSDWPETIAKEGVEPSANPNVRSLRQVEEARARACRH